jgi:hypothetical protein
VHPVIAKSTVIPASDFITAYDDQCNAILPIYEGEGTSPTSMLLLRVLKLEGIPPKTRGQIKDQGYG